MLNGHGGGQTAILSTLAQEVGRETGARILVVNWWSYCTDVTVEVFGEDGGHAGDNETAYVMASDPALVQKERYKPEMASAMPAPNTWSAYPFPSSIMLYQEGQGYPKFDLAKAKIYFEKVKYVSEDGTKLEGWLVPVVDAQMVLMEKESAYFCNRSRTGVSLLEKHEMRRATCNEMRVTFQYYFENCLAPAPRGS